MNVLISQSGARVLPPSHSSRLSAPQTTQAIALFRAFIFFCSLSRSEGLFGWRRLSEALFIQLRPSLLFARGVQFFLSLSLSGGMKIGVDCVVVDSAIVVGKVTLGSGVFVLYNAVLRGDSGTIMIGERTNIQDNCVIHADPLFPVNIGSDVSVGHAAVIHGCTIGNNCIIGIGAVVLNGAVIGSGCIVGAGCVVSENAVIPPNSLVVGVPGKVIRTSEEYAERALLNAAVYQRLRQDYRADDVHRMPRKSRM